MWIYGLVRGIEGEVGKKRFNGSGRGMGSGNGVNMIKIYYMFEVIKE